MRAIDQDGDRGKPPADNNGVTDAIVLTCGEPAGAGADLCLDALAGDCRARLIVIGDRKVLADRAAMLGMPFDAEDYESAPTARRAVWHCPATAAVTVGQPAPDNAAHVLRQLQQAVAGCRNGDFAALVTAPVSKEMILAAGEEFTGQTEYIAALAGAPRPVMVLAGPRLRVALATTHLPLAAVAAALTETLLTETLQVLDRDLPRYFSTVQPPRINVCGLNPHAGEGGYLGDEEENIIRPAVSRMCEAGLAVAGPLSADTAIAASLLPAVDCVLAMYHDQGLPAVKLLDFDETVNVTLGLPFLRVSPDHGIAADLAGSGKVRCGSMRAALWLADAQLRKPVAPTPHR